MIKKLRFFKIRNAIAMATATAVMAGLLTVPTDIEAHASEVPGQNAGSITTEASPESTSSPTTLSLNLVEDDDGSISLEGVSDYELQNTNSIVSLYKKGLDSPIASKDSGKDFSFAVERPQNNFDEYFIQTGDIKSNIVSVNSISNSWKMDLSIDKTEFSTEDSSPILTWKSSVVTYGYDAYILYFVDVTTGKIFADTRNLPNSVKEGTIAIPSFASGGPHEYQVYVASRTSSFSTDINTLQDVKTVSNTVSTKRTPWTVTASIDRETYNTDDPSPIITWTTNQPTYKDANYLVYLIDKSNDTIIASNSYRPNPSKTDSFTIPRFVEGEPREYQIVVAPRASGNTLSNLTDIQAESNTVKTSRSPWEVNASIDATQFSTDEATPSVTWTTNQSTYKDANYLVYLVDKTTNTVVSSNWSDPNPKKTATLATARFLEGEPHEYQVYVAAKTSSSRQTVEDLVDIQAISNTVSTARTPWTVNANVDKAIFSTNDATPSVTWTTNQSTYTNSKYSVYLVDKTANTVVSSNWYGPNPTKTDVLPTTRFTSGGPHIYQVYVAAKTSSSRQNVEDLVDIQAKSGLITVQRQSWNINLSSQITSYTMDKDVPENSIKTVSFTWEANQSVYGRYNSGYAAYAVYIVDKTTKKMVANSLYLSDRAQTATYDVNFYIRTNSQYLAYVAAYPDGVVTTSDDLVDIQAVSNITVPEMSAGAINPTESRGGSNPSEANCNQQCYADPINSSTGEFFENQEDLTLSSPMPLSFSRSYSATSANSKTSLGYGWTNNFNMSIKPSITLPASTALESAEQLLVTQENGSTITFYRNIDGTYFAANRVLANLKFDSVNGTFELTRNSGYTFTFAVSTGKLMKVQDRNNNYLTLDYNSDGELSKVTSNTGQFIILGWVSGKIASVTDHAGRKVEYTYDDNENLIQVQNSSVDSPYKYSYNASHLITNLTSLTGGVTTNTYDSAKRITRQKDPLGNITNFEYSSSYSPTGEKTTLITLPDGSQTQDIYSPENQLLSQTEALGTDDEATKTYVYNSSNQTISTTDGEGNTVNYTFDSEGNVLSITDPLGNVTNVEYNDKSQIVKVTDATGSIATNSYDAQGNLIESSDFNGKKSIYSYNSNGLPVSIKSAKAVMENIEQSTVYEYNSFGYVNSITAPNGGKVTYITGVLGNVLSSTDPNGNTTTYEYDSKIRPTAVVYANLSKSSVAYYNSGLRSITTDVKGNKTEYKYDLNGNATFIKTPRGTSEYTYNKLNYPKTVKDSAGNTVTYSYDARGNQKSIKDAAGFTFSSTWLKNGLLESSTRDATNATTSYTYDANGNTIVIKSPLGKITSASYDKLGRVINSVTPTQLVQSYNYDANGQLLKTIRPDNSVVSQEYDADGNVIKSIDASGAITQSSYDIEGNILSSTDKNGVSKSYSYGKAGQIVKSIDKNNVELSYKYDNMNQLSFTSYDNWTTIDSSYTYNQAGELLSAVKDEEEIAYTYNQLGDLTQRGPPNTDGIQYSYNDLGQISSTSYPSGRVIKYSYDSRGNISLVQSDNENIVSYSYDDVSSVTDSQYGNNVTTNNEYDLDGRLTEKENLADNSKILSSEEITLDDAGFITSVNSNLANSNETQSLSAKNYTYDQLNRLSSTQKDANPLNNYTFDAQSNLTESDRGVATYNTLGQIQTLTKGNIADSYTYDPNGNRVSKLTKVTDTDGSVEERDTAYQYNKENRLTQVSSGSKTVDYQYNPEGLLSNKVKTSSSNSSEKDFSWDTSTSIPSLISDSKFDYIYGNEQAPVAQINRDTNEITYLSTDNKGSVSLLTDKEQNVKASYEYDDYGLSTKNDGDSNHSLTAFGYAGEYRDSDTGNYLMGARWYDPITATFLTEDPIVEATDEPYSYASGNPIMASDPSGLSSFWGGVTQFGLGALDGLSGGISTFILDKVAPGVIDHCSSAFAWGTAAGTVASFFTPGGGLLHAAGFLLHLGAVAKVAAVAVHVGGSHGLAAVATALPATAIKIAGKSKTYNRAEWIDNASKGMVEYRGGIYGELRTMTVSHRANNGVEIHHIPMDVARRFSTRNEGPAIIIQKSDHLLTRTFGGRTTALLKSDVNISTPDVMRLDVKDLLSTPGGKAGLYNDGIREMLTHPNVISQKVLPSEFGL